MKRLIPITLLLCLLLSGCGLADQAAKVQEKYIAPAIEAAKTGASGTEVSGFSGPAVKTDASKLTAYEPAEGAVRLSSQPLTELAPASGYSLVLPYSVSGMYGLVSSEGVVLLDPVLTGCEPALYSGGSLKTYILSRELEGATYYALMGMDGSWATDFEYTAVYPNELGCVCVYDGARNLAVCYGPDGGEVFDTAAFYDSVGRMEADSLDSLADCAGGYMTIRYSNGRFGYMDKDGAILNRYAELPSYFEAVRPFSEGLGAVKINGSWNYLKTDGSYAIYGLFEEAGDFESGVALVKSEGSWQVIDTEGLVVRDFGAVADENISRVFGCVAVSDGGSTAYYLSPSMELANLYDKELFISAAGYWAVGENGVRLRRFAGGEVYFSGATELLDYRGGLYLVKLADGSFAAMDEYSRVAAQSGAELAFVTDAFSGEVYILGGGEAYSASGELLASDVLSDHQTDVPVGGCLLCSDGLYSGLRGPDGRWILRLPNIAVD